MSEYIKFFDEKINAELAVNKGYIKCMADYKKSKDFIKYFKKTYPRMVSYIAGSLTPTSILKQNWNQQLTEAKEEDIRQAEYKIHSYWYDKKQKKLWEEKLQTTKLYYDEVEKFVSNDLKTVRELEKLGKKTAMSMAVIEKHVCKKVICENIDAPELKDLVDDLISEKNTKSGTFIGYIKGMLIEEIEYAKLQESGKTNTTLRVIKAIKETTIRKK